jgi:uncharacterized membrane protein YcaP (DUF421 family)
MDMLELSVPWWQLVVRGTIVYFVLMALLRLSGKRTVGEFTPFDLLVLVLLGDATQSSMIGGDDSLPGGLLMALTLLSWNWLVGFATARSRGLASLVEGNPEILARNGVPDRRALRRANLTLDDLREAMREQGCLQMTDLLLAVLERDGSISVVKRKERAADG